MVAICEQIKDNGEQCRAAAIWGLKRCPAHRKDGGPKPPDVAGVKMTYLRDDFHYAQNRRFRAQADEEHKKLANLFLAARGLREQLRGVGDDWRRAVRLVQLMSDNLGRIIRLLERLDWQVPEGTEETVKAWLAAIEREKEAARQRIEAETKETLYRSPGYWAVYRFVEGFIEGYHYSPTYEEIRRGWGLTARGRPGIGRIN